MNKSTNNDIISTVDESKAVKDVHYVGKINKDIYSCVTKDIVTDEVIITDERIQHIKERHPNDFERYSEYISNMIDQPEYILESEKENTAVILREFEKDNEKFKLILKIKTKYDPENYRNSVISFWKVGETTWKKLLRNKKILYKNK